MVSPGIWRLVRKIFGAQFKVIALNANQHVDYAEDLDTGWVATFETLFADFAEVALDGVESIRNKVVCVQLILIIDLLVYAAILHCFNGGLVSLIRPIATLIGLLVSNTGSVLIDVGSKWFLVFLGQTFKFSSVFKKFDNSLFNICKRKEFFHAHFFC